MFAVEKGDVLLGLKRFRRIAKQDLLASAYTMDPQFWSAQAQQRRTTYERLIELVGNEGVEAACKRAIAEYADLPLLHSDEKTPSNCGRAQAYELFFAMIGIDQKTMTRLQNKRRRRAAKSTGRSP